MRYFELSGTCIPQIYSAPAVLQNVISICHCCPQIFKFDTF